MTRKFVSKNLYFCSYLCTLEDVEFLGTSRNSSGEVLFHFSPKALAEKKSSEYFTGKAVVEPTEFVGKVNMLRDLIFSGGGK
ncbi:MAG: hypothetical protein WD187_02940 [Candidatus Woykebacteria bacterium]